MTEESETILEESEIKEEFKEMISTSSSSSSSSSSSPRELIFLQTRGISKLQIKPHLIKYYRRPSTNIPFIPSIRILKRDIRRKYVEMISNVINSHDAALFSSFIDEFYHPNFSISYTSPQTVEHFFKPLHLIGRDRVKTFLLGGFFFVPDGVEIHSDNKICKRLNENGSRIVGNLEKSGTMIYLPKEIKGVPVDRNKSLRDCLRSLETPPPPIRSHEDIVNNFQLSLQPLRVRSRSHYQIVLDENHRFLSLQVYYYDVSFTPLPLGELNRE